MVRDQEDTWAEAADKAAFGFFELTGPVPDYRWAGGYGHGGTVSLAEGSDMVPVERIVSLEVIHDVGDSEVKVNTALVDTGMPGAMQASWLRRSCVYQLTRPLYDMDFVVELPLAMLFSCDDREFRVDGAPHVFQGISSEVNGEHSGWAGFTRLGDRDVSVVIRNGDFDALELSTVMNWAMPDTERRDR